MTAVLTLAFILALQDAPAVEAPQLPPVSSSDPSPSGGGEEEESRADARYREMGAVLAVFADEATSARITGAVASGILAAGLLGVGVTYVAVGNLDPQLSQKDYEDTEIAGLVMGGAALIPVSLMIAQLVSSSAEEERFAAFDAAGPLTAAEKNARVQAARQSLVEDAASPSLAPMFGGIGFIGGGLVSAAVGGVFLALPHIPDVERGPMTHATGAELIGAGVASLGLGAALLFSTGTTAPLQLRLLTDEDAAAE